MNLFDEIDALLHAEALGDRAPTPEEAEAQLRAVLNRPEQVPHLPMCTLQVLHDQLRGLRAALAERSR